MKALVDVETARHADVLIDARKSGFDENHLDGALYADLEVDLSAVPEDATHGGRHPLPTIADWTRTLGSWGIGPETSVVVYDDRGGILAAARTWWMLRAVGHTNVAVLEGGMQAAVAAGWSVTTETTSPRAKARYPADAWTLPIVVADDVKKGDHTLVDVRAPERYAGKVEPYDPVAGHIAGAINLPCANNLEAGGTFKSIDALREQFADLDPEHTIVSCGSGVTACHTLLALEHAGMSGAALYVGSWSEWCRNGWPGEP